MPGELEFARKHRDRIEALGPARRELLLNYLFVKHVKPRLRNQKLTFNEEEIAKTSFKRSFMREGGARLPKDFGKRRPEEKGLAAIGGPLSRTLAAGAVGAGKGMGEVGALLANLGIRPSTPEEAREAWREHLAPVRELLEEYGTRETIGGRVAEFAGELAPSTVAGAGAGAALAPVATAGRLGAAAVGAVEGGVAFGAYTGEPEDIATGALLGGGLSVALPFIPRAIAGVRGKVRQFRGKPPVVPKAPATELEQALAGEKTKSALLDEISVKRTGKAFAELTEQEASKFGPRIMGEYRASLKTKTAMSPRDRKELAKAVEQGQTDIKAIQTGAASAKAVQRRMAHARELKGSKLTELEEMNIRAGMSPLNAISAPGVAAAQKAGIPVPKPAAAPPAAPTVTKGPIDVESTVANLKATSVKAKEIGDRVARREITPEQGRELLRQAPPKTVRMPTPDINDVAVRAARGAMVTKPQLPATKQVTQATEAGQALKEANNVALTLDERIQALSAIKATEEDFVTLAADQIRDKYSTLLRDGVNSILKTVNKITDAAAKRKYQTKLSKSYLGKLEQIDSQTFVKGSQKGIGREKMARLRARAKAMEQRLPEGQYGAEVELKLEQLRAAGVEVDELMIMKLQSGTSVDELLAEIGRL